MEMTADYLRTLFRYEPDTGALYWRERPVEHFSDESYWRRFNARFAGQLAGNVGVAGYRRVNIANKFYTAHRLIWVMEHGVWPDMVDHINGNKTDNRLSNLRAVNYEMNSRNARRPHNNTSGVVGVSFGKSNSRWHAYIGVGSAARKTLGYFATFEEAIAARKRAERELGYHQNHGRR